MAIELIAFTFRHVPSCSLDYGESAFPRYCRGFRQRIGQRNIAFWYRSSVCHRWNCNNLVINQQRYGRILVRLSRNRTKRSVQRTKFILELIISSKRTIKSHEIQGALSIGMDDRTIDFDRRRSRTPLAEVCGSIVEVHSNGVIEMIHPTARR